MRGFADPQEGYNEIAKGVTAVLARDVFAPTFPPVVRERHRDIKMLVGALDRHRVSTAEVIADEAIGVLGGVLAQTAGPATGEGEDVRRRMIVGLRRVQNASNATAAHDPVRLARAALRAWGLSRRDVDRMVRGAE